MYYKNIISRFILRKNFISRVKMRLAIEKRKLVKNEFDDLAFLYSVIQRTPNYNGQCLIEEVISYLRGLNYIPYNFYGNNETKLRESIITNVLFMPPKIAQEFISHNSENSVYVNKTNL